MPRTGTPSSPRKKSPPTWTTCPCALCTATVMDTPRRPDPACAPRDWGPNATTTTRPHNRRPTASTAVARHLQACVTRSTCWPNVGRGVTLCTRTVLRHREESHTCLLTPATQSGCCCAAAPPVRKKRAHASRDCALERHAKSPCPSCVREREAGRKTDTRAASALTRRGRDMG